jgi:hypothetical protein
MADAKNVPQNSILANSSFIMIGHALFGVLLILAIALFCALLVTARSHDHKPKSLQKATALAQDISVSDALRLGQCLGPEQVAFASE